jgi:hypothetical protein
LYIVSGTAGQIPQPADGPIQAGGGEQEQPTQEHHYYRNTIFGFYIFLAFHFKYVAALQGSYHLFKNNK